jgi:hypothetical protein
MDEALEREVLRRAGGICEYCRLPVAAHPTPFEIDHVVRKQRGGRMVLSNLAY